MVRARLLGCGHRYERRQSLDFCGRWPAKSTAWLVLNEYCERQFVEYPQNKVISDEKKALIDKLLLEKIPLARIARVVDVSEVWL